MKHILKLFAGTIIIAVITTFTACENDALDEMNGKYPVPDNFALSNLLLQNVQKNASNRTITLVVSTSGLTAPNAGTGNYLTIDFLIPRLNYFLNAGAYTIREQSTAAIGNYIAGYGSGGTYWVDVANGAEVKKLKVIDGTVSVGKSGDNYTITGTVLLEDGSMVKLNYAGAIIFDPDPPVLTYKLKVTKPYAWTTDGATFTPITGSQLNTITVLSEGIELAVLDVITEENTTTLAGTYQVKAVTALERAIVQGVYMDISSWLGIPGIPVTETPTYYLDNETKMFVREGTVTITDNGGTLGITGSNLGNQDPSTQFTFGVFPTRGSFDYQDVTREIENNYTYSLTVTKPATYGMGNTPIPNSQLNVISVIDNASTTVATFEVITTENATSLTGSYTVKDGTTTTMNISDANNGFYIDMAWYGGAGVMAGGCYYMDNGAPMYIRTGSTVSIVDNGGVLTITGSNLAILDLAALAASNGANWVNLSTPGSFDFQNLTGGGSSGGDVLTDIVSATSLDKSIFGGTGFTITLKIATSGVTATPDGTGGYTYGGDGNYISLDFNTAAATLVSGTYNIVDNATAATGDCSAGYPAMFGTGYWGSVWGTVTGGTASDLPVEIGGTVDVSESGGVYTIEINASTSAGNFAATYTGPITII